jgi:hypothetical protein
MPTSNCKYRQENLKEKKKKKREKKKKNKYMAEDGSPIPLQKEIDQLCKKNRSFNEAERSESEKPFYKLITFGNI